MTGGLELIKLARAMAAEKAISEGLVFESLEVAMMAAARKKYDEDEDIAIRLDRLHGTFEGTVDGHAIDPTVLESLGRIAAQTFKQVMIQKLREAEQDVVFEEFSARKGELITGTITRFEGENLIIDMNRTESIMPRHERVRTETYHVNDRVRAVISDVRKVGHRVRIVLSRTHPDLVRRLFELEIPEIADHVIEIKCLSREPGFRTKLAVISYDSKVDCVGACVGIRGSRIRNIIDELNGEKIDIIRWNESPEILIMNSLKPAEIQSITLDDDTNEAIVQVADDQLSLAIGKRGQNVRLAARLTGWDVNIVGAGGESGGESGQSTLSDAEQKLLDQFRSGEDTLSLGKDAEAASGAEGEGESESAGEASDPLLDMAKAATLGEPQGEAAVSIESGTSAGGDEDVLARVAAQLMAQDEEDATAENEGAHDADQTAEEEGDESPRSDS